MSSQGDIDIEYLPTVIKVSPDQFQSDIFLSVLLDCFIRSVMAKYRGTEKENK